MPKYDVYFEFYGKNMKTTVDAKSEDRAIAIVRNRINILKIEEVEAKYKPFDFLDDIVNGRI